VPLTPFEGVKRYDPYDHFDAKIGYDEFHDPNKPYIIHEAQDPRSFHGKRMRLKKSMGRVRTHKVKTFSTINSISGRISFNPLASNMNAQYTGLMRKIENTRYHL